MPVTVKLAKRTKKKSKRTAPSAVSKKEVTRLGSALRALGGLAGGAVGSYVGMPGGGATVGTSLGAALSKWLGSGDYTVGSNSIVQKSLKGSDNIPMMHGSGQSIVVRHKEYLGEVRGSQGFLMRHAYELNPGLDSTFPWLSGVACRFQEYRIKGMVFHYIPTSGSAVSSTNAALGSVMLTTSYRSNDSAPANKIELLNEYCSSEAVPSEPFCHPIECDPKENPFNVQYVRSSDVPAGDSRLLYDLGVTYLCVSGQQADNTVLGDLYVTYEIELKKPIVSSNVTYESRYYGASFNGFSVGQYFNPPVTSMGNFRPTLSGRTITFPRGAAAYIITWIAYGNFSAANTNFAPTLVNCVPWDAYPGASLDTMTVTGTGNTNAIFYRITVYCNDPMATPSVTLPTFSFTGLSSSANLTIAQFTGNL
jgi:hypothetical protein